MTTSATHALRPQLSMELWILRPYARQYLLVIGVGLLYTAFFDTGTTILVMMVLLASVNVFSVTESSKLELLFAQLPTSRATVVWARYAVCTGLMAAAGVLGVAFEVILWFVGLHVWSPTISFVILAASLAAGAVLIAIQFPFFFHFGYSRARSVIVITMALAMAVIAGAYPLLNSGAAPALATFLTSLTQHPAVFAVAVLSIGLVALLASAALSVRIYRRKDL